MDLTQTKVWKRQKIDEWVEAREWIAWRSAVPFTSAELAFDLGWNEKKRARFVRKVQMGKIDGIRSDGKRPLRFFAVKTAESP